MNTKKLLDGMQGLWLLNESSELFVSFNPYPRVAYFSLKKGESPFRVSEKDQFFGIRTWFMEPFQNEFAMLPACRPAKAVKTGELSVSLSSEPDEKSGLQLLMEISLDPVSPKLKIRHGMKNMLKAKRRIALWSIMAFPPIGTGYTPWAEKSPAIRSLVLFQGVEPADPCLKVGQDTLAVDFSRPVELGAHMKAGAASESGWAFYKWKNGLLKSFVPVVPGAEYPENGATVTLYSSSKKAGEGFCEVEHVGPIRNMPPGKTLWLEQSLEI